MRRSRSWIPILVAFLAAPAALAQTATLRVETNDPGAHVFADSVWLGTAARGPFGVADGMLRVRVVPSAVGTWGVPSRVYDVQVARGDTVTVVAAFPHVYRIESEPEASVSLDTGRDVFWIGDTPVLYRSRTSVEGTFRVELEGYVPQVVEPGTELWNLHRLTLEPIDDPTAASLGVSVEKFGRPHRWVDYAAIGVAAIAGAVAVHYKRKADNRFDRYRATGDPALRPAIDRYDRYSAVALGTMQVGVGVFAIRLALR